MSVSAATRPFCTAVLLPDNRRKFSIRPSLSISSNMLGMLDSTLVFRRAAQKPSEMVTAPIGTSCSLAWGELVVWMMPSSLHALVCAASERTATTATAMNRDMLIGYIKNERDL